MSKSAEKRARLAVLNTAQDMAVCGLSPGLSGNVSVRWGEGMLITPSAMPYEEMRDEDIVLTDASGSAVDPTQRPSSEWRFHLAALKARPDCNAIVHTHSLNATALACAGKSIPAFHYMVAVAGGVDIPLVPYALFGTEELAQHVAEGLRDRDACLLANHGQVAIARTPAEALDLARDVETLATQYVTALQIGQPTILSQSAMADVLEQFKGYGRGRSKKK